MKTNLFFYSKVKYFILICIFSIIFNSCTDNIEGGNYYLGKPKGEIEARNSFAQILSKALYDEYIRRFIRDDLGQTSCIYILFLMKRCLMHLS